MLDGDAEVRTDTLIVGDDGTGAVEIRGQGGSIRVNQLRMAVGEASTATAEVADVGYIHFRDSAFVGINGGASLRIADAGFVFGGNPDATGLSLLVLGQESGSDGSLHIEAHSHYQNSDAVVGMNGNGTLLIEGGANASIRRIWIGGHLEGTTGSGTVSVSGTGSLLEARRMWIGRGDLGILSVSDSAQVRADRITLYGNGFATSGDGGTLSAPILQVGPARSAPKRGADFEAGAIIADTLSLVGEGQTLEVDELVLVPTGSLEFELHDPAAGNTPGNVEPLGVVGTANLAGTLRLRTVQDYVPPVGAQYTVLTAAAVEGAFEDVEAPPGLTGVGLLPRRPGRAHGADDGRRRGCRG